MSGTGSPPPNINITNIAQANNKGCVSGCGGLIAAYFALLVVAAFLEAGWLLGSWVAVAIFGAAEGSTAAVVVGWIFEILYIGLLVVVGLVIWQMRAGRFGNQKPGRGKQTPQPPARPVRLISDTAFAPNKTANPATPPTKRPDEPSMAETNSPEPGNSDTPQAHVPKGPFCDQCGSPFRQGAKFCSECGSAL